jgi:hypothetical protein
MARRLLRASPRGSSPGGREGLFAGYDPVDLGISTVAGAASGGASEATLLGGITKQVAANAAIGGTSAAASGVVHGNLNPVDVGIGAGFGGAGGLLPGSGRSVLTSQAFKGFLAATGQNSAQAAVAQWIHDHLPTEGP